MGGGSGWLGPAGRQYYADRGIDMPAKTVQPIRISRRFKYIFVPDIGAVEIVTESLSVMLQTDGGAMSRRVFSVDFMRSDMAGNGEMYWLHEVDQNVFKLRERE